jgi:hypothetical protein
VALVRTDVPPKHQFLQEPHSVICRKMAFFIVTTMKTWNITRNNFIRQRPGARQRLQNKQIYKNNYRAMASKTSIFLWQQEDKTLRNSVFCVVHAEKL